MLIAGSAILIDLEPRERGDGDQNGVQRGCIRNNPKRGRSGMGGSTKDEQVLTLVQAGPGATVMPATYSMKGISRPLLTGFDATRNIGLLYAEHMDELQHAAFPILQAIRARHDRA